MQKIKAPIKELEVRIPQIKPMTLKIPEQVFLLNEVELFAIKNTIEPYKGNTKNFNILNSNKSKLAFCWEITDADISFLKVIEINKDRANIHTVWSNVLNWTLTRYIIMDNLWSTDPEDQESIGIMEFKPGIPCLISDVTIYNSINDLKKDSLYKSLSNEQRHNILKPNNITSVVGEIYTNKNYKLNPEFVQHLFLGTIKKGKGAGVHHILSIKHGFAEVVEITKQTNKQGVWEAKLKLLDGRFKRNSKIKRWKNKQYPSTFFPNNWSTFTLLDECNCAFENKIEISKKYNDTKWESTTKSGIPVEIWTKENGDVISIYPIWLPDE